VRFCSRHIIRCINLDVVDRLPADRGVILASNHRSYFDMYLLSSVLLPRCPRIKRMYFPVRSEYFYDRVGGLMVNAFVAGMAMYPPIYREPSRRALNRDSLAFLVDELRDPGTLVGMHPEGRRGKGDDPYALLPAQPGVGEIVHRAQPVVLPVFINGVPRNILAGVRANFLRSSTPVEITITFGEPLAFDHERAAPAGARTSLRISQAIRAEIERLGERDREARSGRVLR
jgi:1-acyl-sn-glycerol-3-phosphate acyltransferase